MAIPNLNRQPKPNPAKLRFGLTILFWVGYVPFELFDLINKEVGLGSSPFFLFDLPINPTQDVKA